MWGKPFKKGSVPWNKGKTGYSTSKKGKTGFAGFWTGKKRPPFSEEWKRKIGLARTGNKAYQWIEDRTKVKLNEQRHWSREHKKWRTAVFTRDNFRCKISNKDCCAYIEAHHILAWRDYEELRFNINNGITLCRVHHPRKRAEEKRLSPYFMELVSVSNG